MATRTHENGWFWRRLLTFAFMAVLTLALFWSLYIRELAAVGTILAAMIATHQGYMGWAVKDDDNVVSKLGLDAFTPPVEPPQ